MSMDKPNVPERVPTLTEVVQMPAGQDAAAVPGSFVERRAPQTERRANWPPQTQTQDEALAEQVLADVQRQIDLMLETRMRETLAPALTRATDALVRDMRHELASTLRDVVSRAVAQELARHRRR